MIIFISFSLPNDEQMSNKVRVVRTNHLVLSLSHSPKVRAPSQLEETSVSSHQVSNEKKGPWLFSRYIGDDILPSYVGVIS